MRTKTCPYCHGSGELVESAATDIRRARRRLDISLRELARQAECSPAYLSALERGDTKPQGPAAERVLRLVGLR